jgi:hypothetical protein
MARMAGHRPQQGGLLLMRPAESGTKAAIYASGGAQINKSIPQCQAFWSNRVRLFRLGAGQHLQSGRVREISEDCIYAAIDA